MAELYNQIFFTNVLRLLQELGMSKEELAEKADISGSFLSDITRGKGNPSLRVMGDIASALGTPLPTLLELTDLDEAVLDELAGGAFSNSLPKGFTRFSAILKTGYEVSQVKVWHKKNVESIRKTAKGNRLVPKTNNQKNKARSKKSKVER